MEKIAFQNLLIFNWLLKGFDVPYVSFREFSGRSDGKESACNAGDPGSIPGLGRSPGEGIGSPLQYSWTSPVVQMVKNLPAIQETWIRSRSKGKGSPLQYSGLENSRDCIVHGVTKSQTWLSDFHFQKCKKLNKQTKLKEYMWEFLH